MEYLGHWLDAEGIHPTGKKYECVQNAKAPCNVSELRSYLGILNYSSLTAAEKNYSQIEREALCIVYSVKHFHKFVAGREFISLC